MRASKYRRNTTWQWTGTMIAGLVVFLGLPPMASGQTVAPGATVTARLKLPEPAALVSLTQELSVVSKWPAETSRFSVANDREQTTVRRRERSIGRKILGGAIGGVAGFFGGGYLGAAIEGDSCQCDDPGLKGALIGAPIGAVTGAIIGALFF